ncbi:MAG: 2-amino-4-hydroxy-6-hydroxymethyldihydropteridine diphosphokinase [Lentisphaeria bacterium]|nr:2-amino-4-hydroxy-6-hydroxymethyldihydropteridine diphosphokinase [Lentisphaerota bacterium]MBR2625972.1 2-amino-4-hydroxy-6-hydroxymethyldihydropteridine diphosphokinase [Lentisphaeria bacterium]
MKQIAIMLGGNLPGSRNAMAEALKKFSASGVSNIKSSSVFHSAAVDCVPGTPDFLDMAFTGSWDGTPEALLELCQRIELEAGRPKQHSSRESRILDCDIILFGNEKISTDSLTVPHPRAHLRAFVLEPMAEIAPEMKFPDGVSVRELLMQLPEKAGNQ